MVWFGPTSLGPAGGAGGLVCRRQVVLLRPSQVGTCDVGSPPGPGRGIQAFSRESPDAKSRGGGPPPPRFRGRSLALARFGGCAALFRSIGYYEPHVRALIWRLSFAKMLFRIFFRENAFQIGLSIPEVTTPLSYQRQRSPKRASESERAINPGIQGRSPGPLSPHFSGEMGTPAGQAGQRGAAPQGGFRGTHPEGTQHRAAPGRWSGLDHRRLEPATWVPRPVPGGGIQAFSRESPDAKSRGGWPPAPPFLMARSLPLARFGGCGTLFRWWGYYGAHLRALIWDAFSCGAAQPRGFPLGGSCHRR